MFDQRKLLKISGAGSKSPLSKRILAVIGREDLEAKGIWGGGGREGGMDSLMGTILLDLVWKGGAWWRVRSAVTTESAKDRCKGVEETWQVKQGGEERKFVK